MPDLRLGFGVLAGELARPEPQPQRGRPTDSSAREAECIGARRTVEDRPRYIGPVGWSITARPDVDGLPRRMDRFSPVPEVVQIAPQQSQFDRDRVSIWAGECPRGVVQIAGGI